GGYSEHPRAGVAAGVLVQYCRESGARVLGIDIDRVAAQRREGELGGAEAGPAIDPQATRFEKLGKHLGEYVPLGEWLRGDDHRAVATALRRAEEQCQQARAHHVTAGCSTR